MANYETREKDDLRVFDGGEDHDEAEGSHLPVVMAIALFVLAAFGGVVWLAYNNGVEHGRADMASRLAAANETPATPPGTGDTGEKPIKVYREPAVTEAERGDSQPTQPVVGDRAAAPNTAPKPAVTPESVNTEPVPTPPALKPKLTASARTPKPQATVTAPALKPKFSAPASKSQAAAAPPALATVKPSYNPAPEYGAQTATMSQQAALGTQPAVKEAETQPEKAPEHVNAVDKVGSFALQIGAYKSEHEADAAWKAYRARHTALLAGMADDVRKADLGPKGIWYRLRVGSFSDRQAAVALCEKLKSDGGNCFLAR